MDPEVLTAAIISSLGDKKDYTPEEFWKKVSTEIVSHIQSFAKVNLSNGSIK